LAEKTLPAFRQAGIGLARGIALMLNMFGPSHLVLYLPPILAEPGTKAADEYLRHMRTFTTYTHQTFADSEVVVQAAGPYDGAHGAALIALERCFGLLPEAALDMEITP
jgi:hypothetical protein